jgi:hypothetical protein
MQEPVLSLIPKIIATGSNLIVVLIRLIALIGIKPKPLRGGLVVDYLVRQNGSMQPVVVVATGSILGVMKLLLVSVL